MIKDPKACRIIEEKERGKFLQSLTREAGTRILEAIISSKLILEFNFAKDDNPIALAKALKKWKR